MICREIINNWSFLLDRLIVRFMHEQGSILLIDISTTKHVKVQVYLLEVTRAYRMLISRAQLPDSSFRLTVYVWQFCLTAFVGQFSQNINWTQVALHK